MKQFAIFGIDDYYPQGGIDDFIKSFDTKEEADVFLEEHRKNFGHDRYDVVDMTNYE